MKSWAVAAVLSFGFAGASLANPLDSPGTVYIDGVPCNLPCQAYMKWSRQALNAHAERTAQTSTTRASMGVTRKRHAEASSANTPQRKTAHDFQAALTTTPEPRPRPPIPERAPFNERSSDVPASLTSAAEPRSVPQSETANAFRTAETSNLNREKSTQEMVMAALAVAGQITSAEAPKAAAGDADSAKVADADVPAPLVALVLSRPDVKSVNALNGLNVAIDAAQSVVEEEMIRLALALVGATEVQLSFSDAPLGHLINGDAQAAVVKLVSPNAAEAFPEIKGFKVFRVPIYHISQSEYEAIHAPHPENEAAGPK